MQIRATHCRSIDPTSVFTNATNRATQSSALRGRVIARDAVSLMLAHTDERWKGAAAMNPRKYTTLVRGMKPEMMASATAETVDRRRSVWGRSRVGLGSVWHRHKRHGLKLHVSPDHLLLHMRNQPVLPALDVTEVVWLLQWVATEHALHTDSDRPAV